MFRQLYGLVPLQFVTAIAHSFVSFLFSFVGGAG